MFGFFSKKEKETRNPVYWEFLGDIFDELLSLTDEEAVEINKLDFSKEEQTRKLIQTWMLPDFFRFSPDSHEKIRNTLAYYLSADKEKLNWIFPSFQIPFSVPSSHRFFSLVWQELFQTEKPDIDPANYYENDSPEFINSLSKAVQIDPAQQLYPYPERYGEFRPRAISRHGLDLSMEDMLLWATSGLAPDKIQLQPADAAKWNRKIDLNDGLEVAIRRFETLRNEGRHTYRFTIIFDKPIGNGYLVNTSLPVKTKRARFLFDPYDHWVSAYPLLR